MSQKKRASSNKSVPVVLEKGEEKAKIPILQVPQECLEGIKNASQLAAEAELQQEQLQRDYYRNKAIFYAGVFTAIGLSWLAFRYFKSGATTATAEVINNVVSIVPK